MFLLYSSPIFFFVRLSKTFNILFSHRLARLVILFICLNLWFHACLLFFYQRLLKHVYFHFFNCKNLFNTLVNRRRIFFVDDRLSSFVDYLKIRLRFLLLVSFINLFSEDFMFVVEIWIRHLIAYLTSIRLVFNTFSSFFLLPLCLGWLVNLWNQVLYLCRAFCTLERTTLLRLSILVVKILAYLI